MPANTLPSGIHDLFSLADRMLAGLRVHGPWLRIDLERILAEMLRESRETEGDWNAARARKAVARRRFATADAALTAWLVKARLTVMLALGGPWSERWLEAGFTHRQTNVPKRLAERMELANRLTAFFARHRELEVPFANVNAAVALATYTEIVRAELEARAANGDAKRCLHARDVAEKSLRRQMSCVVTLLSVALRPGDLRWLDFGLNQPDPDAIEDARRRERKLGAEVIHLLPAAPMREVASA